MNSFVDERHDPLASTEAAAKFLKDLYDIYGDWHLVIAAYNCGPGNVRKAIRRSGGAKDYWKIYYRLPRETRGYVPSFIAAMYVMNNYKEHNLKLKEPEFEVVSDTVMVRDYVNFKQISTVLDVPIEELRYYNPQYKADIIPATKDKSYVLRLPQSHLGEYIDREKEVMAYKRKEFFPDNRLKAPSNKYSRFAAVNIKGKSKVYYKVKSGDNLGFIADWYDVGVSSLRYWNNIRRNLIRVGQRLVVYVPSSKVDYYRGINTMSSAQKRKLTGKSAPATVNSKPQKIDSNYEYHTVRRNENLWIIARKYPGISAKDIMRLNNMRKSNIRVGQKLKIRRRG
jgi:membrane-bound lytic murein transglycosylase D